MLRAGPVLSHAQGENSSAFGFEIIYRIVSTPRGCLARSHASSYDILTSDSHDLRHEKKDKKKNSDSSGKGFGRTSPSAPHAPEGTKNDTQVIYALARILTLLLAFAECPLLG